MRPLNVSAISFLNTAPLVWDFEHNPSPEIQKAFNVFYSLPSQCAVQLRDGSADIGIVPVITTALIPDLTIIPDVAIATKGAIKSILLLTRKELKDVRTVAADTSSRTSVALTQILLAKFFGGKRELVPMAPDVRAMLSTCDAALVIGDPALTAETAGLHVYDLGEVWREKTGEAFVFAVWAMRKAALAETAPGVDVARVFQQSRDRGLQASAIDSISRTWSERLKISPEAVATYLRENVFYWLDEECKRGLDLYFRYAAELELIPAAPKLEYLPTEVPQRV